MKILCLIDSLGSGGAQRQLISLGKGLKNSGYSVTFLYYYKDEFYLDILILNGIDPVYIASSNMVQRLCRIRSFIRRSKFDLLVAFLGVPSMIAAFSGIPKKNWRLITSERSTNPLLLSSLKRRALTMAHLLSDIIVSNSYANVALLKEANPFLINKKFSIIYNSVDLDRFSPEASFSFFESNYLRIVVAASYRKLKNLQGLIEAVNLLPEHEKSRLKVNWYGDQSFNEGNDKTLSNSRLLIKNYKLEDIIFLHDKTIDIEKVIKNADIVGIFSFHEGFPNAVCEGMACGKPIIASNVSDLPLVIIDEVNGKICDPHNHSSISSAISYFLKSDPSTLHEIGKYNREKACDIFSYTKNLNAYIKLINHEKN